MSMAVSASSAAPRRSAAYRRICAQVFAGHIRAARLRDGRPLARANAFEIPLNHGCYMPLLV